MNWVELKRIAELRFIKSMYIWLFIVPITAKALSKLKETMDITVFGVQFELVTSLPFSWVFFYFSAFLFVLANAIYFWHCPKIVKETENYADFQSKGMDHYHLFAYASNINFSWEAVESELESSDEAVFEIFNVVDSSGAGKHSSAYTTIESRANKYKPSPRWIATGCYVIAAFFMVIVLTQNTFLVSDFFINDVLELWRK